MAAARSSCPVTLRTSMGSRANHTTSTGPCLRTLSEENVCDVPAHRHGVRGISNGSNAPIARIILRTQVFRRCGSAVICCGAAPRLRSTIRFEFAFSEGGNRLDPVYRDRSDPALQPTTEMAAPRLRDQAAGDVFLDHSLACLCHDKTSLSLLTHEIWIDIHLRGEVRLPSATSDASGPTRRSSPGRT